MTRPLIAILRGITPPEAEAHADRLGAAQRALAFAQATDDNARAEIERLDRADKQEGQAHG